MKDELEFIDNYSFIDSDKVILKGETRNVASVYKQGAIFVLTSCREGLPLVLLEAKANHLPCVSFDIVSGPNEIILPYLIICLKKYFHNFVKIKNLTI